MNIQTETYKTINTPVETLTGVFKLEKYGFVYIWFDKRDKRYYVGCHWGFEDDGYICSSNWMRNTYRRRPNDFKRKILKRIYTTRQDLFAEEQRYLSMIKPEEVRVRYFNLHVTVGHWSSDPDKLLSVGEKISKTLSGKSLPEETKKKISKAQIGRKFSEEHKRKLSESRKKRVGFKQSQETIDKRISKNKGKIRSAEFKQQMRELNMGRTISEETRQRLKDSHIGNVHSEETKRKMSESHKERYGNGL